MLDWMKPSLRIGLSRTGITVLQVERWKKPRVAVLMDTTFDNEVASEQQLKDALSSALAQIRVDSLAMSVVLADEWIRYFSVTPPKNAARAEDCVAAASVRFQHLYDISPHDWQIDATWSASGPFLACAVPRWLLDVLGQVAEQHMGRLVDIRPQFVCAWNHWHRQVQPNTWFGVVQKRNITCSLLRGRSPLTSHTFLMPDRSGESGNWLAGQLHRTALMLGVTPPARVQLCGVAEAAWMKTASQNFQITPLGIPPFEGLPSSDGISLAMQGLG